LSVFSRYGKRYVRRNGIGQFKESDDVGKSLAADRHKKAKTKVKVVRARGAIASRRTASAGMDAHL
jgi:hypothetical protein